MEIELRNIHKAFGSNEVLKGVDLKLKSGEVHALMGENGAGKSTLMNILTGIHKQDKGTDFCRRQGNQLQKSSGGRSLRHRLHPSGAEHLAEPEHSGKPVFDAQRNQRHGYPGF